MRFVSVVSYCWGPRHFVFMFQFARGPLHLILRHLQKSSKLFNTLDHKRGCFCQVRDNRDRRRCFVNKVELIWTAQILCMWPECTDVTQRHNTDFLSWRTTHISLLRPFPDSAVPFNPSSVCSRRGKMAAQAISSALYLCIFSLSSWAQPTAIHPAGHICSEWHDFRTAPRAREDHWCKSAHVTHTSTDCQKSSFWGGREGLPYWDGVQTIRGDLAPGLSGPGQDVPGRQETVITANKTMSSLWPCSGSFIVVCRM